jgi:hypothetical protein
MLTVLLLLTRAGWAYDGVVDKKTFSMPAYTTVNGQTIKDVRGSLGMIPRRQAPAAFEPKPRRVCLNCARNPPRRSADRRELELRITADLLAHSDSGARRVMDGDQLITQRSLVQIEPPQP